MDVHIKLGDSRSNRSRDNRAAHFVMDDDDEERRTGPVVIVYATAFRLTSSPPIGWTRKNGVPLKLYSKPSKAAFSAFFRVKFGDSRLNRCRII